MHWYQAVMHSYSGFEGRAGRVECWYFMLLHVIILALAPFADLVLGERINCISWVEPTGLPALRLAYLVGIHPACHSHHCDPAVCYRTQGWWIGSTLWLWLATQWQAKRPFYRMP